jgi:hypothetical protein
MNKYENGKIYKLIDNTNGNIYVGSTCELLLSKRLAKHNYNFKSYKNGKSKFVTSFDIIKNDDYSIILLEDYPCKSKDQLLSRERYYIETIDCINKELPTRTQKEWHKANQEKMKEYHSNYREQNKDKRYEKFNCECGGKYNYCNKNQHIKTAKHQKYCKTICISQEVV